MVIAIHSTKQHKADSYMNLFVLQTLLTGSGELGLMTMHKDISYWLSEVALRTVNSFFIMEFHIMLTF